MTAPLEDPFLIALGSAVSDGATVDWDQAERDANDPATQDIVRGMRNLASVVAAHRSGGSNADAAAAPISAAPPARHWRHIVLFESIGAGAFGTVYRGWDPTLDREVAVKLFPNTSADPGAPLEEARHLARVRHSHVVVVYGADRDGDEAGIWMEYIEGRTLAEMVRVTGPMSAREVIGIGLDLCRALAALHGAGLLHRDIKPHNVMREVGGRIVLMDFSGAQMVAPRASTVNSGTPLFMAPELFESGVSSVASEVYSLGILLFFLVSGRLPVEGSSVADLKRAHAGGRRNRLADLRPDIPSALTQVIERALAVDPAARYQTAGEFEHALANLSDSPTGSAAQAAPGVARAWTRRAVLAAGTVLASAVTAAIVMRGPIETPPPVLTRFTIGPPFTSGSWPRVSPDGRYVVFGAVVEGRNRFWVRPLDDVQGRPLMNTTASESPFWSPDSKLLCFFEGGKLKRIPVESGDSQSEILADAPQGRGGDWSGNTIVFSREDGVYKISLTATPVIEQLTRIDAARDYQHAWPEFLPDGRRFLFVIRSTQADRAGVYVASIDGDQPRYVMPAHSRVIYANGHVLYVRQGLLMAQAFDVASATLAGQPIPLSDRVKHHASSDGAFDVSANGVLVFGRMSTDPSTRLMLFDGRGRELRALAPTGHYGHPRFSPDGRRVVVEKVDGDERNVDLWLYDIERDGASRLTSDPAPDVRPAWSPDGKRVVFASKRGAFYDLYTKTVDTTEAETLLAGGPSDKFVEHLSADGRFLTATVLRSGLWIFPFDSAAKSWMFRAGERGATWQSEFSPDARWIAYTSQESDSPEVYVEPFPATGARWQVSTHGGGEPHWRKGDRELVYRSPHGILMAVAGAGGWETSRPTELFHINVPDMFGSGDYTVSPEGDRIVVNTFIADSVVPPIDVVVPWTALLKR